MFHILYYITVPMSLDMDFNRYFAGKIFVSNDHTGHNQVLSGQFLFELIIQVFL